VHLGGVWHAIYVVHARRVACLRHCVHFDANTSETTGVMGLFTIHHHHYVRLKKVVRRNNTYKKLSYYWETVRRESMPRIAEIDVEMTT